MGASLTIPAILTILISSVLIASSMTTADAAIYMLIPGINGDATQNEHVNWIEIDSLQFSITRAISDSAGTQNREASAPSVSEFTLTKEMDRASPLIFFDAVTGDKGNDVTIHITQTGASTVTYVEYKLTNALVSAYSVSSGGDRPVETLALSFTAIEFKYTPLDGTGKSINPIVKSWDLATQKGA